MKLHNTLDTIGFAAKTDQSKPVEIFSYFLSHMKRYAYSAACWASTFISQLSQWCFFHLYFKLQMIEFIKILIGANWRQEIAHRSNFSFQAQSRNEREAKQLQPDKLTVVINGYSESRIPLLLSITTTYAASPLISSVLIVWGNPSTSPKTLSKLSHSLSIIYSAGADITLHPQQSDSLNTRFLPHTDLIKTRAVLICDDDVEVNLKSVEFAFRVWSQSPHRLIGLFARSHELDLLNKTWIYTVHPDKYSIVLTKFMILSTTYLGSYTCLESYSEARSVVDKMRNCEDILMNFVAADEGGAGPVLVAAENVRDWGDARNEGEGSVEVGLSSAKRGRGEHRKRRGECIREFHRVLGRMPLKYSYGKVVDEVGEQGLCKKMGKLVPCDEQVEG
ncbi:LOW QUALITY PROTEIN: uncharacterized protein [Phyllobates terribilis]|uniref:LOW QUALITY PROTEIN: uncharacterized protein n=1 Tax=Phyllobates terribilis TaxID=111132 RepID=UPI003CCA9317